MTKEQLTLVLQQEYAQRREDNLRLYKQREDEACQRCPGLRDLLDKRHMAVMNGVRTSLLSPVKNPAANAGLPAAMARMNDEIAATLKKGGLSADALRPIYDCPLCRDEGYVYAPSRKMCKCMTWELNRRMLTEIGLRDDRQIFERFDNSLFSGQPDEKGVTPRQRAIQACEVCQAYADGFPDVKPPNLLIKGESGLGKTFLLHAMARRLVDRGIMPVYTSAYHFLEVARKAYIENDSGHMGEFMTTSLLLLDDLGTEPLMQNVTVTQLFNLLNERQTAGLHTVVTTNLTMKDLQERYTERIVSRLRDVSCWRKLTLIGDDVRKRLGKG